MEISTSKNGENGEKGQNLNTEAKKENFFPKSFVGGIEYVLNMFRKIRTVPRLLLDKIFIFKLPLFEKTHIIRIF